MKVKKPTTPGQRNMVVTDYSVLTKKKPRKKLLSPIKKKGGRNKKGKITVRHRGGGAKKKYRQIEIGQTKKEIIGKVEALEYDPLRSAFIMLILYKDGERNYQIAPEEIKIGDEIICQDKAPIKKGNRLKIKNIPLGVPIFNIEVIAQRKGKIVRSAGTSAQILAKEGEYVNIVLPSKEIRKISGECFATIGQVSNSDHKTQKIGKAGRKRHMGKRPTVRGSAMNPCDHPHGGGEGRSPIGMKHPKTPWGKPARGVKTRKKNKFSNRFIIKRRKSKKKR
jgi:large subunit ribosomal protein L2